MVCHLMQMVHHICCRRHLSGQLFTALSICNIGIENNLKRYFISYNTVNVTHSAAFYNHSIMIALLVNSEVLSEHVCCRNYDEGKKKHCSWSGVDL